MKSIKNLINIINNKYLLNILKHKLFKLDYKSIHKTGKVDPFFFQIIPLLRCNLRCKMCNQRDVRKHDKTELNYKKICIIINNLKKLGIKRIDFIGGEIFIMKDIYKILDIFYKEGFIVSLGTNGTLLNENKINLLSNYKNIVNIGFSIDGLEKTHDKIRGLKGSFKKTINSIIMLKDKKISTSITTVLQEENINEIPDLIYFLKSKKINELTLLLEICPTLSEINASKKIIKKITGKTPQIFLTPSSPVKQNINMKNVLKMIKKIEVISKKIDFKVNINNKDYIRDILNKKVINNFTCNVLVSGNTQIDWHGNINLCSFIHLDGLGNLLKKDIDKDIINSELYKKIRINLLNNNLLPICKTCCAFKILK